MKKRINFSLIDEQIKELKPLKNSILDSKDGEKICIVFHNHIPAADPDTLSAATALWLIFKYIKKAQSHNIRILGAGQCGERAYNAIRYYEKTINDESYKVEFIKDPNAMKEPISCHRLYVVDTDFGRTGFNTSHFKVKDEILTLDHHNKLDELVELGKMCSLETCKINRILCSSSDEKLRSASTSQLLLILICALYPKLARNFFNIQTDDLEQIERSKEFLTKYYRVLRAGIQTDTGSFLYSNTDNALLAIGKFLDTFEPYGPFEIEQNEITNISVLKYSQKDLEVVQELYKGLRITEDIVFLTCLKESLLREDGSLSNISPIHICQSFQYNAAMSIVWEEKDINHYLGNIELRCMDPENSVVTFAKRFKNGGGHPCAAGFSITCEKDKYNIRSLELQKEFLDYIKGESK